MTGQQNPPTEMIVEAARRAVVRLAPEETEVFDQVADEWRRRQSTGPARWSAPGGSVGFGVDATLLSEVALQTVAAAVGEVLVLTATAAGVRWRRRRRAATPPAVEAAGPTEMAAGPTEADAGPTEADAEQADPGPADPGPTGPPPVSGPAGTLTPAQARHLRDACQRHALALGLSPESAALLADAAVGATVTTAES
ncbi:hypothetical protein [Micromonospora echinofusca]|uniref:Uncharacterized protein n=1 Tax=Micromonospora echinofusca TaxID=47858 RepID=A0ABS3VWY6_MICEH|nr:hypothetical protein [Micromonospora echinofusca]MBO4209050.1 hypothetical protein [Micromonospora echinofusca]